MTNDELELCSEVNELLSENKKLKERIKELEATQPKWISVKDRLPDENGTYVLVCDANNGIVDTHGWDEYNGFYADENCIRIKVTHWMPLPPTPTTESED